VIDASTRINQINAPNQIVKPPNAKLSHDFANFFCDKEKEVDDVLGLALKLFTQYWILRCYANRAGIEMAFAHHDAAFNDERSGSKTELIRTKQRTNHNVTPRLHLTVSLHAYATAQAIEH
jgi:hypothetical protein